MNKKCKHDEGWCSVKSQAIFTNKRDNVEIGFSKKSKWGSKVLFECNYNCGATRNLYFNKSGKLVKFGNIIPSPKKPCFCKGDKYLKAICKECNDANCVEDDHE